MSTPISDGPSTRGRRPRWMSRSCRCWDRVLGLADLAAGDYAAASTRLAAAVATRKRIGFREPAIWRIEGDAIEAAVGAGDLDSARAVLAELAGAAGRSRIPWNRAVAARCE